MKTVSRTATAASVHAPEWAFGSLWLFLVLFRLLTFEQVSVLLDCQSCLTMQAWPHELQFLAMLLAVHAASAFAPWSVVRLTIRILLVLILMLAWIDTLVIRQFYTRLHLHEFLKFLGEPEAALEFLQVLASSSAMAWTAGAVAMVSAVVVGLYLANARSSRKTHSLGPSPSTARRHRVWATALLTSAVLQPMQQTNFHTPVLRNPLLTFFEAQTRHHPYQPSTPVPDLSGPWPSSCMQGQGLRPDMILLVVESLSSYQSKAWGGHLDWWPQLDGLQTQGLAHMQFLANGITTEDGLVALLTGQPPIPKPDRRNRFEQFTDVRESLPRMLGRHGYRTAFLTSGDLGFLDKGAWLQAIGFGEIQGHDHPDYDGLPRFHFQAPPDQALYRRALSWMKDRQHAPHRPFFLTIETVSTHQPYIDPNTGQHSMEKAFRYADEQLGAFVQALQAQRYFEHGLLVIVGDHRAMVPLSPAEQKTYGTQAYNRVPMLAIGASVPKGRVQAPHAQIDLLPGLAQLVSHQEVCVPPSRGLPLTPQASKHPDCIVTRRPYDLDLVFLMCGQDQYTLKLDAENTRQVAGGSMPLVWLDWLHRLRRGVQD